eukprot:TRINITY_DN16106_c0_g1_i1.p1 TRINITY_DN16106_c0_g1~~TRINITY_DN16106_c0_g1_i1.p1  ORF type:complete len:381 (-),score=74.00 TRINITY_DN16106_c0_g1_i1:37-1179(-)
MCIRDRRRVRGDQIIEETLQTMLKEELEKKLQALAKSQREMEINFENKIRFLEEEKAQLDENFRSYKLRANAAMSQSKKQSEAKQHEGAISPTEDDIILNLRNQISELKNNIKELLIENEALRKDNEEVLAKFSNYDTLAKENLETLNKYNELAKSSAEREIVLKQKAKLIHKKYLQLQGTVKKNTQNMTQKNQELINQINEEFSKYKEQSILLLHQKTEEINNLKDTIELLKQNVLSETRTSSVHSSEKNESDSDWQIKLKTLQSEREQEVDVLKKQLLETKKLHDESEKMINLYVMQVKVLKEEIRKMDRDYKRENTDITYLKNVVLQYMITQEHESLVPVISTVLQFSPEEIASVKKARSQNSSLWSKIGFFGQHKQ